MSQQALLSVAIENSKNKTINNILSVIGGTLLIALLAQVVIRLPWTPVPITGQTLGVTLVALSWGRRRAFATVLTYLTCGAVGLPVFAMGSAGITVGPTLGYLIGMLASSLVVGELADRGWTGSFWKTLAAAFTGSLFVFSFGLLILSRFVPGDLLLGAGLLPFLPGDMIKNLLAASLSWKAKNKFQGLALILICLLPLSAFAAPVTTDIVVTERGFSPGEIKVKAGDEVTLSITRKTDETCAKEVMIPSRKIKKDLPLGKTVQIALGKVKKGQIKFGCAMDMMDSGVVLVE